MRPTWDECDVNNMAIAIIDYNTFPSLLMQPVYHASEIIEICFISKMILRHVM